MKNILRTTITNAMDPVVKTLGYWVVSQTQNLLYYAKKIAATSHHNPGISFKPLKSSRCCKFPV